MAILYVASESIELAPFAALLTGLRKLSWPIDYAFEGIWEGTRIVLAANGAGPRLSVQAVEVALRALAAADLSASKLESVVSTGFCGGLDPTLCANQIVVANEVLDLATGQRFACAPISAEPAAGAFVSGAIATQDRVANDAAEKGRLQSYGAVAVDMEAAAVAAHVNRAGLPFSCIKAISDCAGESFGFDLNRMRSQEGRIARGKLGIYALKHPNVIPELMRLKRRARLAAQVLGDFLVNCRINPQLDVAHTA